MFADELIDRTPPEIQWLEFHPENYVGRGGRFEDILDRASARWPMVAHGLSLCFGNVDPVDAAYVTQLRVLLERVGAPWYSDHLCFGANGNAHLHDLLPVLRTAEMLDLCAERIRALRAAIGRPVAVENVSYYAETRHSTLDDATFTRRVVEAADCALMLDVNNVWVNSVNHGFDPRAYLDALPLDRVIQMHVAGHLTRPDGLIIDTHAEPVCDGVFALLEFALRRVGPCPVLLERDGNYPELDVLLSEVRALAEIYDRVVA